MFAGANIPHICQGMKNGKNFEKICYSINIFIIGEHQARNIHSVKFQSLLPMRSSLLFECDFKMNNDTAKWHLHRKIQTRNEPCTTKTH